MPHGSGSGSPQGGSNGIRDLRLDNARGILVTLVIAGHVIEPFIDGSAAARAAYVAIYAFHIPALVLISGYLSHDRPVDTLARKLAGSLLVPYVVLEAAYSIFDFVLFGGDALGLSILTPYWLLWYLPALAAWRLALPFFLRFKRPLLMGLLISLSVGTIPQVGTFLTASRIAVFLPVFLLGHRVAARGLPGDSVHRRLALAVFLVCTTVALVVAPAIDVRWLYGSRSYAALNLDVSAGLVFRSILLLWSTSMAAAFVTLVGRRETMFAGIGVHSMYPYVLHGFVVMGLARWLSSEEALPILLALSLASIPLAGLLASRPVRRLAAPLLEPLRFFRSSRGRERSSGRTATGGVGAAELT